MTYKVSKLEGVLLIMAIMVNGLLLNIPSSFLQNASTGLFLNTIYITILAIIFAVIINRLFKPFDSRDILDVSEYLGGKPLKIIVGVLFLCFFILIISTLVRFMSHALGLVYFNTAPIAFILLFFLVPVVYINKLGLKAIARINTIILPLTIIGIVLIALSLWSTIDFNNLFPILGYGLNETFLIGTSNIVVFATFTFLYLLPPFVKEYESYKKISIIATVLSGIYLIFTSTLLLVVFPYITHSNEIMSNFLLARLVQYGDFIQRIDALFIFSWILATLSYLSITFFFTLSILKKLLTIKKETELAPSLGLIILGISLLLQRSSHIQFIEQYVYKFAVLVLVFGLRIFDSVIR